ncbi:MAG TPA: hypothetical protein VE959_31220 [Bryobacteraceae bacterium]|nr:hypothetical protein [Bryobacteraceae bacterium]
MRFALVALLALGVFGGRRIVYPQTSAPAAPITSPNAQSFLLILGIGEKADTNWDGSITATGGAIQSLTGWRFKGTDSIMGTSSWKMLVRMTSAGPNESGTDLYQENGLIVTIAQSGTPVSFDVKTTQGNFSFTSQDVSFGASKAFLNSRALVMPTAAPLQLTSDDEEEDFPAMAQAGDDVYLAYTRFVHGNRTLALGVDGLQKALTDFTFLSRPTGMDQILLLHYSKGQRTWTGPFAVTNPTEDAMRNAVAIDGQGRAWVFYSTQRNGNFDIYARSSSADGAMSPEIRLTTDSGTDIYPVAATDATGRVWVAWQGYRNDNLEILAAAQNGDTFTSETIVSTSPASDWDAAIAAAPNGEVAISWDTYDKGDYDVYLRRVRFAGQIGMDDPIPIAATLGFEARSSLAYDAQNRLWIAYEVSGPKWGKDFGAYDTTGIALYQNHTIQVRCLMGNDLYTTTQDVAGVLPGALATQLFLPTNPGPFAAQPDPTLVQKRQPNDGAGAPAAPKNTFPRLATDPDGTVYLAFRRPTGSVGVSDSSATGQSIGTIWVGAMVYYDGAQWHGPGVLGNSDGLGDNRPAILPLGSGRLLIGQANDHRLSPLPNGTPQVDSANSDIYALELPVARQQQSPQLTKIGQVTPAAPDPAAAAEAAANALNRSYRPTVNGQQMQLLRGDFHRHTELSFDGQGDGPLEDGYRYAIDAAGLGWFGCCDHDDGSGREYSWWMIQKFTDAYTLPSKILPMYYYERSVAYPEGHRNVLFATRGIRTLPRLPTSAVTPVPVGGAPDTNMLYAYLHFFTNAGSPGISAPHTSATDQGTDWRNSDPVVEPFVEIYQGDRQDYEGLPDSPRTNTAADSISGYEASGYVSNALGKGIQLGFEASSDHISTHISFTNVWVSSLTRAGILAAMKSRHLYGSTDYILADFRSGTHFMGDTFTNTGAPVFSVRLFGTAPFQKVVLVKNSTIIYSTSGGQVLSFTYQDQAVNKGDKAYYYVRGVQTDGQIVWVSPMWVTIQ